MSFNIGLSGLQAATADLDVTSNNIANVGTVGFKESRAEFGDIYAVSMFGSTKTAIGSGVLLSNVAQQHKQGNPDFTDNSLDLAIEGQGFFIMKPGLGTDQALYTRAGAFGVNDDGYVINSAGHYLQVFPVNPDDGTVTSTDTRALQLPAVAGTPQATSEIDISLLLPPSAPDLDPTAFDATDSSTYTHSTSMTAYDSLGNSHIVTLYFIKTDTATNTWETRAYVGDQELTPSGTPPGPQTLNFNTAGVLTTVPSAIAYSSYALGNGADPLTLTIDYAGSTQSSPTFSVLDLDQNGYATGQLTGVEVDDYGIVRATYSNEQSIAVGKVALATFANPQGLRQIGNTSWVASQASGEPIPKEPGTAGAGNIQPGALESSTVDLTEQLIHMITAQRNFQANSKSIETANAITQTILNIR